MTLLHNAAPVLTQPHRKDWDNGRYRRQEEDGAMVTWVLDDGDLHAVQRMLGMVGAPHLAVESLGENGWDRHVWDMSRQVRQQYGLADTLTEAKRKAEAAAELMTQELNLAV
jgi:hypothetical protein